MGSKPMKEVLGISAIALLFGITGASAEERAAGKNLVPVAERNVHHYGSRRWTRYGYYRGRGWAAHDRYSRSGDRYIGGGPYPERLTPGGVRTGPQPRSSSGGG
jgi:hypothetical protein